MIDNKGTRKERQFKEESSVTEGIEDTAGKKKKDCSKNRSSFLSILYLFLVHYRCFFLYFVHTTNETDTALQ